MKPSAWTAPAYRSRNSRKTEEPPTEEALETRTPMPVRRTAVRRMKYPPTREARMMVAASPIREAAKETRRAAGA